MRMPIIYVGGSKGGVGKSKMCYALIHFLTSNEKNKVLLVETDTSNPDVYKAHSRDDLPSIVCKQVNLDVSDGWIELVNLADEMPDHHIVINSAARSNAGTEKYGATLRDTLPELQRDFMAFWMINRQRDSVELLREFLKAFPDATIHVFRNLYFGEPEKFELYNGSKARSLIEEKGKTFNFPDLADRVADKVYSQRLPLAAALQDLPLADKAELRRWIGKCSEIFSEILS